MTEAVPARPSPATLEEMAGKAAVEAVREASRQGRLATREELLTAMEADGVFLAPAGLESEAVLPPPEDRDGLLAAALAASPDIASFQSVSGRTLYHAPELLSRTYARILDRQGSPVLLMAEEIRANSRDYPRPVPAALFGQPPFGLSPEDIALALRAMAESPEHQDIACITANGGESYLFSTRHLERGYALFLAQRAESLSDNP